MKVSGKFKISCLALLSWISSEAFSQKVKENTPAPEKEITICHLSSDQIKALTIPLSALSTHLEHGDFIGDCSSDNSPLKIYLNKTDVMCHGGNTGSVDLDIQFAHGHPPFNIIWSTGAATEDISNLQAGTYSVTVSLGNGLSSNASITVNEPELLAIDFRVKHISCAGKNDGEIMVIPMGGIAPYSIVWSSNAGAQSGNTVTHLAKGIYRATVTDAAGCISIADIPIEEPIPLTSTFSSRDVLCYGGNDGYAAIVPSGGVLPYSFQWSQNAGTPQGGMATNLSSGTYSCTITDANGCQTSSEMTINEPALLDIQFSVINESCAQGNDGSATALVSGGVSPYAFQWDQLTHSQNQASAVNLSQGKYFVLVSDNNGCMTSSGISVGKDKCECMLRNEDCGATVASLAQFVYCNPILNATNYQWEFTHKASGFTKVIQRGSGLNNFHLTWVPGIQYGKSYDVRIKAFVNGMWNDYGPLCQLILPGPVPSTGVRAVDCGISTTSLNQQLFCDFVAGAQNYQWEFSNADLGFLKIINRGNNSLSFTLGWVQGIQYGKTYHVRVRANVGGEWGSFGNACEVSLVYPIPTTKVRFADCGITLSGLTQNVFCDAVAGATDYQWEISNSELNFFSVYNRNSNNTSFQFAWISGVQYQTAYNVRVRAKVAGEWAEFGFACQITTPAAPVARQENPENGKEKEDVIPASLLGEEHRLSVFPNPSKGETISISLSGFEKSENSITVEVYDILGNKVFSKNSAMIGANDLVAEINNNGELATGIYILNVTAKNKNYFDRIIVK